MSCGIGMIKYLLFIFNFIFAVCGLGILAVGVIVHLKLSHMSDIVDNKVMFPSITLIVIGSIIFVISFFGCCGAIRESHCMTVTFASFLLFILLVQVAVAVYAFVAIQNNKDKEIDIKSSYKQIFEGYWNVDESREVVNVIQSGLQCCGVDSSADFRAHDNFTGEIPWSCCGKSENEEVCVIGRDNIYPGGCAPAIRTFLAYTGTVLGGVAIGIAAVELTGIIFALCLANSIRNTQRRGYRV